MAEKLSATRNDDGWRRAIGSMSWARRVAGSIIAVLGLVLLVSVVVNNLFRVGPDFEELVDDFRPMLAEEAIATTQSDIDQLSAVSTEFNEAIVPALSAQLGMSEDEFVAFTATNYPAVATGVAQLPAIATTFDGLVTTLDSQRELFESADAIPTESVPATTVPWGLTAVGLGALLVAFAMTRPGPIGLIAGGVLGSAVVVATLALSLVPKANDADELNGNLEPVYTPELVAQAGGALDVVGAMGTQMQAEMLPDLGAQLGLSEAELEGFLGENFPATASALSGLPQSMERFESMTQTFDRNLDNYDTIKPVSFAPIIWTLFGAGLVILAAAGAVVALERRTALATDAIDLREPAEVASMAKVSAS